MQKISLILVIFLSAQIATEAQLNKQIIGAWSRTGFTTDGKQLTDKFRFGSNNKGILIQINTSKVSGVNCSCNSVCNLPFTWRVSKDSIFVSFDLAKISSDFSIIKQDSISNGQIEFANSACRSATDDRVKRAKQGKKNIMAQATLKGGSLFFGGVEYKKE